MKEPSPMTEPDELDLLLKWGLRDLYPEVDPSPQVWERLRERFRASVAATSHETDRKRLRPGSLSRVAALFGSRARGSAGRSGRAAGRSPLVPPRPGEAIYDEQQTAIHLWVLANALGNHAF